MTKQQNTNHKYIYRCVVMTGVLSISCGVWGSYNMFKTAQYAYDVNRYKQEIVLNEKKLATLEQEYFVLSQVSLDQGLARGLIEYSQEEDSVRYAQVGGAVFSLVSRP